MLKIDVVWADYHYIDALKRTKPLCCDSVFTNDTNLLLFKDSFSYCTIEPRFSILLTTLSTFLCHLKTILKSQDFNSNITWQIGITCNTKEKICYDIVDKTNFNFSLLSRKSFPFIFTYVFFSLIFERLC